MTIQHKQPSVVEDNVLNENEVEKAVLAQDEVLVALDATGNSPFVIC